MQWFLSNPESGLLNLEAHQIALAIVKNMLDENYFRTAQKTIEREPPSFKIGNKVYFKKQMTRKMGPQMETWIQDCLYWACWTLPGHQKSGHRKDEVIQPQGHSTWTTSRVLKHWHTIQQSRKIHQPPCTLANHHTEQLKMNTLLM